MIKKLVSRLNLGVALEFDEIPFSVGGFEELITNGLNPMGMENYIRVAIDETFDDYDEWLIFMDEKFGGITNLQLTHDFTKRLLVVRLPIGEVEVAFFKDYLKLMSDNEFEDLCYAVEATGVTTLRFIYSNFTNERLEFVLENFEPIQKSVNYSTVYGLKFQEWLELDLTLLKKLSERINVNELIESELVIGMIDYLQRDKEAIEKRPWLKVVDLYIQKRRTVEQGKVQSLQTGRTGTIEFDKLDIEKSVEDLNRVLVEENSKTLFIEDSVNEVRELHKMSGRFDRFLNLIAITQN